MSTILNTYPIFESNQVLTSTQLNTLVNYLDEQERLTRARLVGMGIVCGLEISYDAGKDTVSVSRGIGITSEGHLLVTDEFQASHCRHYHLPEGTLYEPFLNSTNKEDLSLYELLAAAAERQSGDLSLEDEGFLQDKVVLLFFESFDKDLKSCLGKSCDELGKKRILTIRKLLVSRDDLKKIWSRTNTGKPDPVFPDKFNLPVITLRRVLFRPGTDAVVNFDAFWKSYAEVIADVFEPVVSALSETYTVFRPLLQESYKKSNPFTNEQVKKILRQIQEVFLSEPSLGIQYVYDFFRDILLAYHEFRQAGFELMSACSQDMGRFPRHLMLGDVLPSSQSNGKDSECRHSFVMPPIYNAQKELVAHIIFLHNRLVLMIESFLPKRILRFLSDDRQEGAYPIRITPSMEKQTLLGQRSIPWYYAVKRRSLSPALGTLKEFWNPACRKTGATVPDGLVLNYEEQVELLSKGNGNNASPLNYDIDEYPFLRIEGHIGKNLKNVLDQINSIKEAYNLPVQVLSARLNNDTSVPEPDYRCGFEDIQEDYDVVMSEFTSFLAELDENCKIIVHAIASLTEKYKVYDTGGKSNSLLSRVKRYESRISDTLGKRAGMMSDCIINFSIDEFQKTCKDLLEMNRDLLLVEDEMIKTVSAIITNARSEDEIILIAEYNQAVLRMFDQAHQIADLVFYRKMLRLYYFFKRREHSRRQSVTFTDFLRKHPGIDHQAGSAKGGTFVIVYQDEESQRVMADFTLPYICCETGTCVPLCHTEKSGFIFDCPPLACPDFAITCVDTPVAIDVTKNDVHLPGDDFDFIRITQPGNGKVILLDLPGHFLYIPNDQFSGYDMFEYTVKNNYNKKEDTAKVRILVLKVDEAPVECYNEEILNKWGREYVEQTLRYRKISFSAGLNIFSLLLEGLRKTGGFSEAEITSGVLEDSVARERLLDSLGIAYGDIANNEDRYSKLGALIRAYQRDHCSKP
jgi:hypothetical protein